MSQFTREEELHIRAAEGWLGLGSHVEARKELQDVPQETLRSDPVLRLRWQIEALAQNWEECVSLARQVIHLSPDESWGWIHNSYALHELKRTGEAYQELVEVARKFKDEPLVFYNLACYCAQLGRLAEAEQHLDRAMQISPDPEEMRAGALEDPDLAPLKKRLKPGS
jgi:predicted Zn-dependent protease